MKRVQLLLCLSLLMLIAAPVALAQTEMFYVDGTCAVGARANADGKTPATAICIGSPPNYATVANLLPQNGTLVYIFVGGYCNIPITNGVRGDPACLPGSPPGTGAPFAPALLWGLGGILAVAVIIVGVVLRRRGSAAS
jgi:hypothetical protein